MNSKMIKELRRAMLEQFGSMIKGVFYEGSKGRVYLSNEHSGLVDLQRVNAEGIGVYVGRINPDGFRLSIEGAQLIKATKNVFEISKEQLWDWLRGYNVKIETDYNGYCVVTHQSDVLGGGKVSNGTILNFTPRERRIKSLINKQPESKD
jgi:NOL1/NOP2/fmu family ribosome biogenesis protein